MTPLLTVIGILLVVGVLLWGLSRFPAIDPAIVQVIRVIVIVIAALWIISLFFPIGNVGNVHVGK